MVHLHVVFMVLRWRAACALSPLPEAHLEALPWRNPKAVTGAKSWIRSAVLMAWVNYSHCGACKIGVGTFAAPAA